MGPIDRSETSVGNCYSSLRKIQIERSCYGKSLLKSSTVLRGDVLLWNCKPEGTDPAPDTKLLEVQYV